MVAGVVSAAVLTVVGGISGYLVGGVVGLIAGTVIGFGLGAVYGRSITVARSYDLGSARGLAAFVVDHTWSVPNTFVGALYLSLNLLNRNRIDHALSAGRSCVHLVNGVFPRYLTTIGTVIAGVDADVHAHEHGHILQARVFGPLYIPLVLVNYAVATIVPYWLIYHDHTKYPVNRFSTYFLEGVYPHVWNEAWCYWRYGPAR